MDSYERALSEIQSLKKQLNTQKLSHEATLGQLQTSHKMNTDLQEIIKNQANNIGQLKKEISEKTMKLQDCVSIYETQLIQMKNLIETKDEELKKIRKSLCITDYDMIRLRILNQVQLSHDEEINELKSEMNKLQCIGNEHKKQALINKQKFQSIKQEMQKKKLQFEIQVEDRQVRYTKELNRMFDQLEIEKSFKRQLQRSLQSANKKYNSAVQKYEKQLNNLSIQQTVFNHSSGSVSSSNLMEKQSIKKQLKNMEEDLREKEEEWMSMKKKYSKQNESYKHKISQLQKDLKQTAYTEQKINIKLKEKEQQCMEMQRMYERKLKQQKQDHEYDVNRYKKQIQRKNNSQFSYGQEKQNHNQYQFNKSQINSLHQKNTYLESEIHKLNEEIKKLRQKQSKGFREKEKPNSSVYVQQRERDKDKDKGEYREKLKQANLIIVSLLKEKATLKQQVSSLKK